MEKICPICANENLELLKTFTSLCEGESDLGIEPYFRELHRCAQCGHFCNLHDVALQALYEGEYWDQTYAAETEERFLKVMGLPPEKSDNRQRVANIDRFWAQNVSDLPKTLLDIGCGLGVFPAAMKEAGWTVTALDPDARAIQQVINLGKVDNGVVGLFPCDLGDASKKYHLVSFNKVLEHVPDPISVLTHARKYLESDGVLYVELPDGASAYDLSPDRQEFFLEHYGAFSAASMMLLIEKAGFRVQSLERLVEPSGKFTLRAFAR